MQIPFIDLKAQFRQIESKVVPAVTAIMAEGAFIGGPQVTGFEEEFAAFCDSRYCVGVNSGTDALRFALIAAGLEPGDDVITVPNTFIATSEAVTQAGGRPVFADVNADTCNIDPEQVERRLTPKTRAILPVHLYGQPADMDALLEIAGRHNLLVIEDACQAHGALYKGRKAGSMGLAGCFSFYPGKNLGAFGDAGAVVTQDSRLADTMRMIRDHGQEKKYFHPMEGYNGRLDAIQAAVLRIKLNHLQAWNDARRRNAALYNQLLADVHGITLPVEAPFARSNYHLYVIHLDRRDALQKFLAEKGIATGLHYPLPLHLQAAYRRLGYTAGDFPNAERSAARLLSLPMFAELSAAQIEYIAAAVRTFMNGS